MEKRIFKNSAGLLSAQVIVKLISFGYVIFLARSLPVADFGQYIVALSYFGLLSSIADFGMTRFLGREIALKSRSFGQLISGTVFLRFGLLIILFAVFAGSLILFDNDLLRRNLSLLVASAVILQSLTLTFDAVFIALGKANFSSLGILILGISTTAAGVILIKSGLGPYGAALAIVIGQLTYFLSLAFLGRKAKLEVYGKITRSFLKEIAKGSLPYGLLGVLGLLYFKVDSVILSYLKGAYETGIYGAAYKFLEALVFIPTSLSMVIFPVYASLQEAGREKIQELYPKMMLVMGAVGGAFALAYLFLLPLVVQTLLPNYLPAVGVVRVLALSIPLMFIHVPLAQVLLSSEKYLKQVIAVSLIPLLFNVMLNFAFIPQYGYLAAAWITVLSDALSLLVLFYLVRKYFS